MNLPSYWKYKKIDISNYKNNIFKKSKTVMEKCVDAINHDILNSINKDMKLLEVGCGCSSYIFDHKNNNLEWEGIDVVDIDKRGRKTIASKIGSVENIPFEKDTFDLIISNQSIEHWHEYDVEFIDAFNEIHRVLKMNGTVHLNFPMYLHGHSIFVTGDLEKLISQIDIVDWKIRSISAYYDKKEQNYKGWEYCGFPYKYISKYGNVDSSFVVDIVLKKKSNREYIEKKIIQKINNKNRLKKLFQHGLYVFLWKSYRKLIYGRSGIVKNEKT